MIERIVKIILIITLLISSIILIFTIPYIVGGLNVSQIIAFVHYYPHYLEIYFFGTIISLICLTVIVFILILLTRLFVYLYDCIEPLKTNNGKINRIKPQLEPPKGQKCYEKI